MPEITVLIAVYNAGKYLRESIESILELCRFMIIDDGPTDNSIEIINSYEVSRVRFVKNEQDVGISRTLNRGMEFAASDIIARMDTDD